MSIKSEEKIVSAKFKILWSFFFFQSEAFDLRVIRNEYGPKANSDYNL